MPILLDEKVVTVADKTFFQLRDDIVEGAIPAGTKLSEAVLSGQFEVSRAVIRESINRLESCHLVERKANVGARVVGLDVEGLRALYQVREALEGMAARLAAEHMNDDEASALHALLGEHEQHLQDSQRYYQAAGDMDFHYRIVLGSKNALLMDLLMKRVYHLARMYRVQLGMTGPRTGLALKEHRHIVDAIAARDPELAEMLMRRHIACTRRNLEKQLQ